MLLAASAGNVSVFQVIETATNAAAHSGITWATTAARGQHAARQSGCNRWKGGHLHGAGQKRQVNGSFRPLEGCVAIPASPGKGGSGRFVRVHDSGPLHQSCVRPCCARGKPGREAYHTSKGSAALAKDSANFLSANPEDSARSFPNRGAAQLPTHKPLPKPVLLSVERIQKSGALSNLWSHCIHGNPPSRGRSMVANGGKTSGGLIAPATMTRIIAGVSGPVSGL